MALTIVIIANFVQMDNREPIGGRDCHDPEGCTPNPRIKEQNDAGRQDDLFYDYNR